MASNQLTTPKKIAYFSHYPHYFMKPYKGQDVVENNDLLLSKLNSKNCEWMIRPDVALSESSQSILENLDQVTQSQLITDDTIDKLNDKLQPLKPHLDNINTGNKATTPTSNDIYRVLQFALDGDSNFDDFLKDAMTTGASMYVLAVTIRAMRAVLTNPELYAAKLQADDPVVIEFKNTKTITSLQHMLEKTICKTPAATSGAVRNLAQQLAMPGGSHRYLNLHFLGNRKC